MTSLDARFGVNYTPSVDWAHAWQDLNADNVRRDFEGIASLGLDHVRLLPLWPVLQPNRTLIRQNAVDDVALAVELAQEQGLDASVDVIQGHMSSFDFLPAWVQTWHWRNMFTNPQVVEGELALVEKLGSALADLPGFLGLTLGNEINQFSGPPHPDPMPASQQEVTDWLESLLSTAEKAAPAQPHLHAEYDAAFYLDGHPFTPAHCARIGDMTAIHSWIFNGTAQQYGAESVQSRRHAEYMIELSRAFAVDPDRPIWLQEVGAPSNCLRPEQMPDFLEETIRNALSTRNLWGVTWWCSHDVSRKLADFPELEYTLGLFDSEGNVKPIGERMRRLIGELREHPVSIPERSVAVAVEVDEDATPLVRPALAPGGTVFEAWMDLAEQGRHPAVVLSSDNPAQRGITEVITVRNEGPASGYSPVNTVV